MNMACLWIEEFGILLLPATAALAIVRPLAERRTQILRETKKMKKK
jgi:hypothetical protein